MTNPDTPRLITITEAKTKLAELNIVLAKEQQEQADELVTRRKNMLKKLANTRKTERAALAASHKAKRAKLAAYLDVLKLEGEK